MERIPGYASSLEGTELRFLALEIALHRHFESRRVNLVNLRREYFHVTLQEIRDAVAELHGLVTFRLEPEAEQYRTTVAMRKEAIAEVA